MRPGRHLASALWRPLLAALCFFDAARLAAAHSPTYDDECPANCCQPKRDDHTFSQAFYLKGAGGVELHLDNVDIEKAEIIHWDVVFRGDYQERPDASEYELYVGCGGCAPNDLYDENWKLEPKAPLTPVLEAFTQTTYYPLYDKDDPIRQFDSSLLADCPKLPDGSRHFTIRLKPLTDKDIFWAPVLGCPDFECEVDAFTAGDLFLFPRFILHNQRGAWSEYYEGLWWGLLVATATMVLIFLCPLWCCRMSTALCVFCGDECGSSKGCKDLCGPHVNTNRFQKPAVSYVCEMLEPPSRTMCTRIADHNWWRRAPVGFWNKTKGFVYERQFSVRGFLYFVAVWATLVSLFNGIFNVAYSVRRLDPPYEYESRGLVLYIWVIVVMGHLVPLVLVSIIWWKATNVPESRWRRFYYGGAPNDACGPGCCQGAYVNNFVNCRSPFWAHGCWWFVELVGVGIGGFFWLGTGLWVCSGAITLAALWRCFWTYCSGRWWSDMPDEDELQGILEAKRAKARAPRAVEPAAGEPQLAPEVILRGEPVTPTTPPPEYQPPAELPGLYNLDPKRAASSPP